MWSCWARLRKIARRVARVGRFDVGYEPGLETLTQPVLERLQVVGRSIGGEHDLPTPVVEGVERME